MGGATFLIGCIPSYESIGFMAPVLILILRLLQGLALGGEYGGAATYVAEHSPNNKRGLMTSWIQTTATVGLFVSLLVIMGTRAALSTEDFNEWGMEGSVLGIYIDGVAVLYHQKEYGGVARVCQGKSIG